MEIDLINVICKVSDNNKLRVDCIYTIDKFYINSKGNIIGITLFYEKGIFKIDRFLLEFRNINKYLIKHLENEITIKRVRFFNITKNYLI